MFGRKTLEFMLICIGDEMRDSLIHCFHNDLGIHSLDHNYRGLCQTGAALYNYVMLGNAVQENVLAAIPLASLKVNHCIAPSGFPREG